MSVANAFTVDLEDWFQGLTSTNPLVSAWPNFESRVIIASNLLLPILHKHRVKATFFVLGYVADQFPDLIYAIHAEGHEIAIHGYYHRFVYQLTPAEFATELKRSITAVKRITGQHPQGHRAPYFSVNATTPWAFNLLVEHGLIYDSSVFPVKNILYGFPNAPRFPYTLNEGRLLEFPVSTLRLGGKNWPIAGGFYVRALPYFVIRWAIKRLNAQGQPAIMYVHPWELDTGQSYRQVTPRERITHYHGRGGLAHKLDKLFSEFSFVPLRELIDGKT